MSGRIALLVVLGLAHGAACAADHSIAAKAGLLGLGLEYSYSLSPLLAVRAGVNGSKLGFGREEGGIDYDFDLDWDSLSLALDVHPLAGVFRVSAGLLRNDNRLEGVSRPTQPVTIGGRTYAAQEVGALHARVDFDNRTAPFIGVGWDWSRRTRLIGFSFDVGVALFGGPRAAMRGEGPIAGDPVFQADIAREEAELQDALRDFKYFPYATFGLVVRF